MAKKKNITKGITIENILDISWQDLQTASKPLLRAYTNVAIQFAKMRQSRLKNYIEKNNIVETPTAFRDAVQKSNTRNLDSRVRQLEPFTGYREYDFSLKQDILDKISDKKISLNEKQYLQHKFKMAQNFLRTKTSTITGFREVMKQTISTIEKISGVKLQTIGLKNNELKSKLMWKLYNKLIKSSETKNEWGSLGSSVAIAYVDNYIANEDLSNYNNMSEDDILDKLFMNIKNKSTDAYESNIYRHLEDNVDDIFTLGE